MAGHRQRMDDVVTLIVPSHPKYLHIVRSTLHPLVMEDGFSEQEAHQIVLAVDEACSNIIKYAYERDYTKTITVNVRADRAELVIELIDSGKKPDVSKIAPRKLDEIRPGGLGTHFMATVFDKVEYDTSKETGTVLTLAKRKHDAAGEGFS